MLLPALVACSQSNTAAITPDAGYDGVSQQPAQNSVAQQAFAESRDDDLSVAIFAGGCFWCTESDFEKIPGVVEAISGYTGGRVDNPNYKQVSYTETGHFEAVKVIFDPKQVSYRSLVDGFWKTIDPTDASGQFCDKGTSYRSAIFALPGQLEDAKASKSNIVKTKPFEQDIVTPVLAATTFYEAEDYHQDYYKTNSLQYRYYRNGCGRDRKLAKLWGAKK